MIVQSSLFSHNPLAFPGERLSSDAGILEPESVGHVGRFKQLIDLAAEVFEDPSPVR